MGILWDDDDYGGGDPRRCPRHPGVRTSSDDGMHDAPCGQCEAEEDQEANPITPEQIAEMEAFRKEEEAKRAAQALLEGDLPF